MDQVWFEKKDVKYYPKAMVFAEIGKISAKISLAL